MSVVGIDLGTTNTVVACVRSGKVHVLADEHGQRLLPSVVSFHPNGEVLVGAAAKARRVIDPKNTVYSHKRLIGRSWGSPEIAQAKQRFAFELREGPGQGPLVHARKQDYTLPEISAFVLKRARQIAEQALGTPVERAVITVPAHFNELQRASTKVAGRVSGLEVLRILNEPTAAALAYGLGRTGNERVAVYDFGGGTFDCTLLDLNGNVFEVLATAGDSFLGGDDVDAMIADRMAEVFLKAHRYDPRDDAQMFERLKTTAEDIKMVLSTAETHTVSLKDFGQGLSSGGSSINFQFTLTRKELDQMITPLVDRSFKVTQDALSLARLTPTSFDKVILVGGSTRIPLVRKRVESFFGAPPMDRVNPDEVVAIGAAIQAAALTEGARKRSIPAPPPVPGAPRTLPGGVGEVGDTTYTSEMNAPTAKPGPAFGSAPPAFGFTPDSNRPPVTRTGPPPTGATGARPPQDTLSGGRKITNPGVAPAQPPGARVTTRPDTQAGEDDPSIASFPDLAVPTPFEWFPSGQPSSGDTKGDDPQTVTKAVEPASARKAPAPRPAAGQPSRPSFGAIDEPPSLLSTPSASIPSFPSMQSGAGSLPSPIGEPEPFAGGADDLPGPFGAVRDLSLISSTGQQSSPGTPVSGPGDFGHVSDLSLISTSAQTAAFDPIAHARQKAVDEGAFDDETEANARPAGASTKGNTLQVDPGGNPAAVAGEETGAIDLPAVVQTADLPAAKRPVLRKTGQVGMGSSGGSAMLGKPPPVVAPQPFGPMSRIGQDDTAPPQTAAMPNRPASPVIAKGGAARPAPAPAPSQPKTQPQPGRPAAPNTTAPIPTRKPGQGPQPAHPAPAPLAATQLSAQAREQQPPHQPQAVPPALGSRPPAAFASAPPAFGSVPPAFGSAPPPAFGSAPPPAFGSMPAPVTAAFGSPMAGGLGPAAPAPIGAPPPMAVGSGPTMGRPDPFGSQPPPGFGAPPGPGPGGPAGYGGYPMEPPAPQGMPGAFDTGMPMPMGPAQTLGFAAPVLVDVTPRALVVETAGGYTDTIIPRNSKIPCERTRRFATGRDMQTTVRVRVAQGEHQFFPQNTYLGEVELSGLRPAPRGEVVVAVTFEVDADGTLRVRARDVQTGQEARAVLQLVGVADESSVVMMINRFASQPVVGGGPGNVQ